MQGGLAQSRSTWPNCSVMASAVTSWMSLVIVVPAFGSGGYSPPSCGEGPAHGASPGEELEEVGHG